MALIGEMQYLTIGDNTYSLPSSGGSGTVTSIGLSNATNGGLTVNGSPITNSGTITVGHSNVLTSAQTTSGIYPIKIDKNGHISEYGSAITPITDVQVNSTSVVTSGIASITVPSITLNGSATTSPSFYAPTSAGTSGYVLKSNGSGAPTWTSATLTDTLVTQTSATPSSYTYWHPLVVGYSSSSTEGFTPSTSTSSTYTFNTLEVQPSSGTIRLGGISMYKGSYTTKISSDTLTANRTITVPDNTGTMALTSDIHNVPSGGTSGQVLTKSSDTDYALTWANVSSTDEKLALSEVTESTTYYPIVGTGTAAATRQYDTNGFIYTTNSIRSFIELGNNISEGTTGSRRGAVRIYGTTNRYTQIETNITSTGAGQSTGVTVYLPDKSGTIAMTSDIPTVPTITLNGSSTTSPSFYAPTSAGTSGYYLKSNGSGAPTWATIPAGVTVTLNGSTTTTPSFYAPTGAGTSGQYLKSNGSGAPSWTNFPTIPSITLNGSANTSPSFYAPITAGTSGYVLTSSGSGAPSWSNATATPTASTISKFDSSAKMNSTNMTSSEVTDFVESLDLPGGGGGSVPTFNTATITLTTAGWSNNSQTVTVSGVTASNIVIVNPAPASYDEYVIDNVRCTGQNTNSLTFSCDFVPSEAITVSVIITSVTTVYGGEVS